MDLYTTPSNPGAYSGLSGFIKNNKKVKELDKIKSFEPYSLHKYRLKKFPRRKTAAHFIDEFWQVDLIDVS